MARRDAGRAGREVVARHSIRQQQRDATRERLAEAAVEVFAKDGFLAAKVDDIAKAAGVGRTTFYLHFPTKLDVANEIGVSIFDLFATHVRGLTVLSPDEASARRWFRQYSELVRENAAKVALTTQANVIDAHLGQDLWDIHEELGEELLTGLDLASSRERTELAGRFHLLMLVMERLTYFTEIQGVRQIRPAHTAVIDDIVRFVEQLGQVRARVAGTGPEMVLPAAAPER